MMEKYQYRAAAMQAEGSIELQLLSACAGAALGLLMCSHNISLIQQREDSQKMLTSFYVSHPFTSHVYI